MDKNNKISIFEVKFLASQESYGREFGTAEPSITIRSYMPRLVKIARAFFEKSQKRLFLGKKDANNGTLKIKFSSIYI